MKNLKASCAVFCAAFGLVFFSLTLQAQVQTARYISMTSLSKGFYEYLPQGYSSGSGSYPLLIFVHGMGELGNGSATELPRVLANGTPKQINQGIFPTSFTVKGQTFRFIVISPQFTDWPNPIDIKNVIDYAVSHYRVDINRIYLTGLSMGGGVVWAHTGNSLEYANRIAAIVPVAGANWPDRTRANNIAAGNVRVWATHNNLDPTVEVFQTNDYVKYINEASALPYPDSLAKKTIFSAAYHDAWTKTYDLNFRENGLNVYEWMLQYKKSNVVLPVSNLNLNLSINNNKTVLNWTTYSELNNTGFEIERSADGVNFVKIGFVASNSLNNNGATYSFNDVSPLNGKNYYRLKQLDADGQSQFSPIKFVAFNTASALKIIYDNAANRLNIRTENSVKNTILNIYNNNGQLVKKSVLNGNGNIYIGVQELPAGVYSAQIKQNSGTTVQVRFSK